MSQNPDPQNSAPPRRVRVKICGLTRSEDVREACRLGADALGFVFYPPSPRAVTIAQAEALLADPMLEPEAEAVEQSKPKSRARRASDT